MIKLLFILILALSCQDYNSNSGDKFRYGPLGLAAGSSAEFTAAYVILQIRCASCHRHSNYAGFKSEQAWKDAGFVVGGNTDASTIITRIRNYEGTGSDMPDDSGPIPDEEFAALKTWVQSVVP